MTAVLRWTGLGKLASFYRYLWFNAPRTTTGSGVVLVLGVAAIRLYLLLEGSRLPAYLAAYFGLLIAGGLVASVAMAAGRRPAIAHVGWALGSVVSAVSIAIYIVSRTLGLPGLSRLVGRWDYPLGSFSMALAVLFLAVAFSVFTGVNVAVPDRRDWHD